MQLFELAILADNSSEHKIGILKFLFNGTKGRSAKLKTEVVLSLLCGESAEELSRKHGVTMAEIAQWRDEFR